MKKFQTFIVTAMAGLIAATSVQAATMKRNDPKRPVAAIAADLDITTQQFVDCFANVNPAPKGTKASGARERANKAILLPCLQDANPSITNAKLDSVMDKYRPEGRVAEN
jgi:hypothetical protein